MITLPELQKYMGIESYFDLYKWMVSTGHSEKEIVMISYKKNKVPYMEDHSTNPAAEKVEHKVNIIELKALAFDDVYKKLPDVDKIKAFRCAYLTTADPGELFRKLLNTIPLK